MAARAPPTRHGSCFFQIKLPRTKLRLQQLCCLSQQRRLSPSASLGGGSECPNPGDQFQINSSKAIIERIVVARITCNHRWSSFVFSMHSALPWKKSRLSPTRNHRSCSWDGCRAWSLNIWRRHGRCEGCRFRGDRLWLLQARRHGACRAWCHWCRTTGVGLTARAAPLFKKTVELVEPQLHLEEVDLEQERAMADCRCSCGQKRKWEERERRNMTWMNKINLICIFIE